MKIKARMRLRRIRAASLARRKEEARLAKEDAQLVAAMPGALEKAPRSPWSPVISLGAVDDVEPLDGMSPHQKEVFLKVAETLRQVPLNDMPPRQREVFLEAVADLGKYNLTQPSRATGATNAIKARRQQLDMISGGRAAKGSNLLIVGIGGFVGLCAGAIVGLSLPENILGGMGLVFAAVVGTVGGAWLATKIGSQSGYHDVMIRTIANERLSPIIPEKVTGRSVIWIPKALVAWRAEDWRYVNGKPYLWLQLPHGVAIHDALQTTLDYITLENDLYRATNAAVYAQRNRNRMISDSADRFQESDTKDEQPEHPLKELLPYVTAAAWPVAGLLVVLFTSG